MELALDKPDLLASCVQGLTLEEKHLVYLELMIMEQVADWEIGVGRAESQDSGWDKACKLVVNLPNGSTKTIGISQGTQKRYWFGICPISSKIGNLKMCGGCKVVGYVGKEEQVNISYEKIHIFWGGNQSCTFSRIFSHFSWEIKVAKNKKSAKRIYFSHQKSPNFSREIKMANS